MRCPDTCRKAAEWVRENSGMICKRARAYGLLPQLYEDFLQDAVIVATEAMMTADEKPDVSFQQIFWVEFKSLLWNHKQSFDNEVPVTIPWASHNRTPDYYVAYTQDQKSIENRLEVLLGVLSPTERTVVRLVADAGHSSRGRHSLHEVMRATGYKKGTLTRLLGRARKKAEQIGAMMEMAAA